MKWQDLKIGSVYEGRNGKRRRIVWAVQYDAAPRRVDGPVCRVDDLRWENVSGYKTPGGYICASRFATWAERDVVEE